MKNISRESVFLHTRIIPSIICAAVVCISNSAQAWNNVGHRTVAEFAWRQLTPTQRREATELLKHHPHYKTMLASDIPDGVSKDEWVFLSAAVWPDWVRPAKPGQPPRPESVTKYNWYPHALGHPFLKRGETNEALIQNFFVAKPTAEMGLSNCLANLRDPNLSEGERAANLAWAMHLMGDLHQPLHAANRVTSKKPRGEGLGGDYIVLDPRAKPSERRTNMHSFWDQLGGVKRGYGPISELADELVALKPKTFPEYREDTNITAWVQEGFRAARDFAYSEDHLQFAYQDDLKHKRISESEIPTLTSDYIAGAKAIAYRRMALAGQRLGDELGKVFKP